MDTTADWNDRHHCLYYGGNMPETYLDDGFATPPALDDEHAEFEPEPAGVARSAWALAA